MAKMSIDAEFALHEFSVRYRASLAKDDSANALQAFLGGVKEQFAQEQAAQQQQAAESPSASHQQEQQHQVEEPEAGD
jgi:hypothetical protein